MDAKRVYVAVDVHTLDLLHINLFPHLGKDSARTCLLELRAAIFKLRQQVDGIFQAKTRRTVEKRYAELMSPRDQLVQAEPRLKPIFDSLVRHYSNLVNAYDHPLIPLTNNTTERLIAALISTTKTLPASIPSRRRAVTYTCSS